jgi:hypothetical protein
MEEYVVVLQADENGEADHLFEVGLSSVKRYARG